MNVVRMASPEIPTKPIDQVFNMLPGCFSAHGGEHLVAYVLERHVDVPGDLGFRRDSADQLVAPMGGMRVEQSDPKSPSIAAAHPGGEQASATLRIQRLARSGFFLPEIHAEIRCILTYQVNLLYSFGDEMADFGSYGGSKRLRWRPRISRNYAKAARHFQPAILT